MNINLFVILQPNIDLSLFWAEQELKIVYNFGIFPCSNIPGILSRTNFSEYFLEFFEERSNTFIPFFDSRVKEWNSHFEFYCQHRSSSDLLKPVSFEDEEFPKHLWILYSSKTLSERMMMTCDIPDYYFFEVLQKEENSPQGVFVFTQNQYLLDFRSLSALINQPAKTKQYQISRLLKNQNLNRLITTTPRKENFDLVLLKEPSGNLTTLRGASTLFRALENKDQFIRARIIDFDEIKEFYGEDD